MERGVDSGLLNLIPKEIPFADGKGSFRVKGQINFGVSYVDNDNPDGSHTNVISSGAEPSRVGFRLKFKASEDLSFSTRLRMEFSPNRSDEVDDFDDDAGCNEPDNDRVACLDRANFSIKSQQFGKISFGLGGPATDEIGRINLGETNYYITPDPNTYIGGFEAFGAGLKWEDLNPGPVGLERATVIRYDTPSFAGFKLSAAWGENEADEDVWDVALRYAGEFGAFRVAAGAGYNETDDQGSSREESVLGGSASIKHTPTGLFLSGGAAVHNRDGAGSPGAGETDSASQWHIQAGIEREWLSWGDTYLTVQYIRSDSGATAGDFYREDSNTNTFGIGITQTIDAAATDIYAGYQHHTADLDATDIEDADVFFLGSRIRF